MNKVITVSCIGTGHRGTTYMSLMKEEPDKYKIVSLCDKNSVRLEHAMIDYDVKKENCFLDENEFFKEKRSDVLIISTLDQDHIGHLLKAFALNYDILLEKPITDSEENIEIIKKAKEKSKSRVFVCHVLRFAPAFLKAKELLDSGVIGKLQMIDAIEQIDFYHFAHSYVRGNYANSETSSPLILAKCCHDLDLLVWYSNSLAEEVHSFGKLEYFTKENMPKGASLRCKDCKVKNCHYNAYDIYIGQQYWARPWVSDVRPLTDDAVREGLDKGKYGRCVYQCGNDVNDSQAVLIKFKNGVIASFRTTACTWTSGRIMKFYGSKGQIDLDESLGQLQIKIHGQKTQSVQISSLVHATEGHGGGDRGLVNGLYEMITSTDASNTTSLEYSLESHRIAFMAEHSYRK